MTARAYEVEMIELRLAEVDRIRAIAAERADIESQIGGDGGRRLVAAGIGAGQARTSIGVMIRAEKGCYRGRAIARISKIEGITAAAAGEVRDSAILCRQ